MLSRTILAATVCTFSLLHPLHAQLPPRTPAAPTPQPAPPAKPLKDEESAKLLAQLSAMSKKLDDDKFGYNSRIIRELREAGVTADKSFALWLDAVKDVDFDQQGKSAGDFADWKRHQTKDANRERDAAIQLQVQWLAIVLMHTNARTDAAKAEAVNAAVTFVDSVVDRIQKADGRLDNRAYENVLNSVIARHYKLESSVGRMENAAYVPGEVDSIYDRMILPHYRNGNMGTTLMQAWAKRIEQQTAIGNSHKAIELKEKFQKEKLPELKWGQAMDLFTIGQEETAAQQMLSIIQGNLAHKSASRWMEEMMALLKHEDIPKVSPNAPATDGTKPAPATTPPRDPGKGPGAGNRFPGGKPR